jgi:hypothetical protein
MCGLNPLSKTDNCKQQTVIHNQYWGKGQNAEPALENGGGAKSQSLNIELSVVCQETEFSELNSQ